MKKIFFFLFCFLSVFFCLGQNDTMMVVSNDNQNIIYRGFDNPVSVAVAGIPSNKIRVSISNGCQISGENGKYIVNVKDTAIKEVTISSFLKGNENKKTGVGIKFRVKDIPPPNALLMGRCCNEVIPVNYLKSATQISAGLFGFQIDLKFPIISFDITLESSGKFITERSENNYLLSEKQKELLNSAKQGDTVYIEHVKVKNPGGKIIYALPATLKVIDKNNLSND